MSVDVPTRSYCEYCSELLTDDTGETKLSGGAVALLDDGETYGPQKDMLGYLEARWTKTIGAEGYLVASRNLFERTPNGSFAVRFCTVRCLRGFLMAWVDDLERCVEREEVDYIGFLRSGSWPE